MATMRLQSSISWLTIALLLLAGAPWPQRGAPARGARADAVGDPLPPPADAGPLICFVIRTYWGHGTYGDNSLSNLLWALAKQQHQK